MASKTPNKPKISLSGFEDVLLFEQKDNATNTSSAQATPVELEFSLMEPLPEHQFRLYEGQRLEDMVASIKQFGILCPIILWHCDDRYIILSGHNRVNCGRLAGLTKGPVTIMEGLTQDEAILIAAETNLRQRSFADLAHSERAYCLAQHYDAMKSQGKRNDLLNEIENLLNPHDTSVLGSSAQVVHRSTSREKIGNEYGLSHAKVARYIRIASLLPPLLKLVDTEDISLLAAYDISFITNKDMQQWIADLIELDGYKLDMKKAELLRDLYKRNELTEELTRQVLSGEKLNKPKKNKQKAVTLKRAFLNRYFESGQSPKEIEDTIDKALSLYFEYVSNEDSTN